MKKLAWILILITCALSGCKQLKGEDPSGVKSDTKADVQDGKRTKMWRRNAEEAKVDPKGDVIEACQKLIALKELSAIVDGEGKLAIRKDVKFVAPDRYHIKFDDATGAHVEMISIGSETYIKDGDAWNKFPGKDSPTSTFRYSFTDEAMKSVSDAKFEGEETINGKAAFVYTYKLVTVVGNFPTTQKLWIDQSSGLPIKAVAEYTNSQEKTLTTVFDTETPVSIEPPNK